MVISPSLGKDSIFHVIIPRVSSVPKLREEVDESTTLFFAQEKTSRKRQRIMAFLYIVKIIGLKRCKPSENDIFLVNYHASSRINKR